MGGLSAALPSLFAVLLLVPLAGAGQGSGEVNDWPTLHGDAGRTGARGSVEGPGTGETVWRFLTESINVVSSPAVAHGRVYIGASDGNVYALDAWTGEKVWAYKTEGKVRASPVVSNGTVFVGSSDGYLYALDAVDGAQRWRFELGGDVRSTATVHGGTVFVGSPGGVVYALDVLNGSLVWSAEPGEERRSVVGPRTGMALLYLKEGLYFGSNDGHVYAVNATNGATEWQRKLDDMAGFSLASDGTRLFAVAQSGSLYALDLEDGSFLWVENAGPAARASPSVHEGVVYRAGLDGLHAFDAETGRLIWHKDSVVGYATHAAVMGGHVYVVSKGGTVSVHDLKDGAVVWQRAIATHITSSPVVVDGILYVGSNQFRVFALDAGAGIEPTTPATTGPDATNRELPVSGGYSLLAVGILLFAGFHRRERLTGSLWSA